MEQLETRTQPDAPVTQDMLGILLFWLAVIALALAPTQLLVKRLVPSEFFLVLAAVVWAIRWFKVRDTRSLPPLANWLFILAAVFSAVGLLADADFGGATHAIQKEIIKGFGLDLAKLILYFLIGYTVFRATFTTPQRVRTAIIAVLTTTTLAVMLALVQRGLLQYQYQPDPANRHTFILKSDKDKTAADELDKNAIEVKSPYSRKVFLNVETPVEVSSTFGSWDKHGFHASRTAYAGFLALLLPFALVLLVKERRRIGIAVWLSLLLVGAAVSVLAGYIVPAILLGLLVTGFALGRKVGRGVLLGIVVYLLLLVVVGGYNRTEILNEPFQLRINAAEASFRYNGVAHLKKFWGEQQAALNLLRSDTAFARRNPLFGVGLGQYQSKINTAYGSLAEVTNQRLESDAQNGYLLTAVSMGILGLVALFALFGAAFAQAWRLVRSGATHPWAAALLGALVALFVMMLFSNALVRGSLVIITALLAMIGNGSLPAMAPETTADILLEQKDAKDAMDSDMPDESE